MELASFAALVFYRKPIFLRAVGIEISRNGNHVRHESSTGRPDVSQLVCVREEADEEEYQCTVANRLVQYRTGGEYRIEVWAFCVTRLRVALHNQVHVAFVSTTLCFRFETRAACVVLQAIVLDQKTPARSIFHRRQGNQYSVRYAMINV